MCASGGNRYDGVDNYAVKLIRRKARQLIGRAGFFEADVDDLEQALVMDLLRRLRHFDPGRATHDTFVARVVDHAVATLIDARKAGIRDYRKVAGSLDELCDGVACGADDAPRVLNQNSYYRGTVTAAARDEGRLGLRLDLERAMSGLPPHLREVSEGLTRSTVAELSRETGVPRGTIYESIAKIRAHFERAGLAGYFEPTLPPERR